MVYWGTASITDPDGSVADDYAVVWRAAEKIVFSTTLEPSAMSASADRTSRRVPCGPASSTSFACSGRPWSSVAARPPYLAASGST
ncbi:MAG: hypothetical protein ABI692_02755 [Terracoccus sp.]